MLRVRRLHPPPAPPRRRRCISSSPSPDATTEHARKLYKLITCSPPSALDRALDASGIHITPSLAERVVASLENAGILAYRFFLWSLRRGRAANFSHTTKSYHSIISSLAKIRQYSLMWDLVATMRRDGLLNVETFCIIMRKYARTQRVDEALYTFDAMEKHGVAPNLVAFHGLLSALCKSKHVPKAHEVFDKMRHRFPPDAKAYSILLEGWGRAPNLKKMREVYDDMVSVGCRPDIITYGIMVDALCKTGNVTDAVDVMEEMRANGCPPTSFIYSVIIHTYGAERRMEDAEAAFADMERRGVATDAAVYNALISGFCKASEFKNAFRVLRDMEEKGVAPNARTCNIILSGFISAEDFDGAYKAFRRMIKRCEPDADTYTMMMKMFCERDRLDMAMKVCEYMKVKQFIPSMHTFSVLINGLCEKGEVKRACAFMEEMIDKGIPPSGSTFGKLRQLLLKEGRVDVVDFLVGKMNALMDEPLHDDGLDE